jgi:hypothetical protein
MLGEQDSPCVRKNEGDDCDVDPLPSGFPGYRGTCVLPASKGWGRRRLLCKVPDLELTREQGGCWLYFKDGSDCVRPSGAQGVCRSTQSRVVPAPGGVGTVTLPILECRHVDPDHSNTPEARAGMALVGFSVVGAAVVVVALRRRKVPKEPPAEE